MTKNGDDTINLAPTYQVVPLDESQPRVGVSISQKVNLGNYESAEVFLSLTNLRPGTSAEEIAEALEIGQLAYKRIRDRMVGLIERVRSGDLT